MAAGAGGSFKSSTAQVREAWQERDRIHTANTGDRVNTGANPKSSPADSVAGQSGKSGSSERVNGLPPSSFATPLYGAGAGGSANATPLSGVRSQPDNLDMSSPDSALMQQLRMGQSERIASRPPINYRNYNATGKKGGGQNSRTRK